MKQLHSGPLGRVSVPFEECFMSLMEAAKAMKRKIAVLVVSAFLSLIVVNCGGDKEGSMEDAKEIGAPGSLADGHRVRSQVPAIHEFIPFVRPAGHQGLLTIVGENFGSDQGRVLLWRGYETPWDPDDEWWDGSPRDGAERWDDEAGAYVKTRRAFSVESWSDKSIEVRGTLDGDLDSSVLRGWRIIVERTDGKRSDWRDWAGN